MKLLGISGALRRKSTNTGLLRAVKELCPAHVTFDIATLHGIPMYDGDLEDASGKPESVASLDRLIRDADGVIIATPEYNFTIPGVLKNATDWLSRGGSPFKWKRVGVIGASGGPVGTARVQYHLRQNLQGLEAITMPKPEFFAANNTKTFGADGDLTDADTRKFLSTWLLAFIDWVEKKP